LFFTGREFKEAVFDIFNCQTVQLVQLLFHSNMGQKVFFEKFRGNTGAVAVGYREYPSYLNEPHVTISHSQFINNKVDLVPEAKNFTSAESVLTNSVFPARGGSLGILINESVANVTLNVNDCLFARNYAQFYGGAIFSVTNGYEVQHNQSFDRIRVISNSAGVGAGGVFVAFISATQVYVPPHSALFTDCLFHDNVGVAGGAMFVLTSYIGNSLIVVTFYFLIIIACMIIVLYNNAHTYPLLLVLSHTKPCDHTAIVHRSSYFYLNAIIIY